MIGKLLEQHSFTRRMLTRAAIVGGAVFVGGLVMRSLPHDQTLIFPVGTVFPNATRFVASWREPGDAPNDPRGGVTLTFTSRPPSNIRQHVKVPNGDYIVTIEISTPAQAANTQEISRPPGTAAASEGLQTNIERRVTLSGGETTIALAAGGY